MVDHFLNNSVVDRLVLLAVVDIVVPEMAFVGRVVGSLGCAFCGDLVVGDNLGPCVGQTDGGHCPKSSLMSCLRRGRLSCRRSSFLSSDEDLGEYRPRGRYNCSKRFSMTPVASMYLRFTFSVDRSRLC